MDYKDEAQKLINYSLNLLSIQYNSNGIVRNVEGEDDMTEYTEEAQDFFNERYDYWWDYLYDQKVGADD